jgi:hypothetical protein
VNPVHETWIISLTRFFVWLTVTVLLAAKWRCRAGLYIFGPVTVVPCGLL